MSRKSQLIARNTGPIELRPSDVLIERFEAWKRICKNLIAYFEGIADIENNTSKELTKLGGVIQVPFHAGNQFLGDGGMQDIFFGIREKTRNIADHHANLARTVDMSIVQHLQKLRAEIKAHIKNIQMDTGKLAVSVAKEREVSTKVITDLARSITMLKNTPMHVTAKEDPWYTNSLVARQLQKQVQEENALQKSIIIMQQNSEHFEEGVVRAIQTAWETFDNWSNRMSTSVQDTWATMGVLMKSVQPNTEWLAFAARSDHLLDPETPLRNIDHINYPGKDDPSVLPVHEGMLERKKRFTSNYSEGFYVLTPAGYLHELTSSDGYKHPDPRLSLFLPECTLGAPSTIHSRSYKFHIEGRKGNPNTSKGAGKLLGGGSSAFTFRASNYEDMMEWWNDAKQLSKVYLTTSEPMDRSGPVPAAVRSAGYLSEEEDEEENGSSVEEEESEEEDEEEEETTERASSQHTSSQRNGGSYLGSLRGSEHGSTHDSLALAPAIKGPRPSSTAQQSESQSVHTANTTARDSATEEDAAPGYSAPASDSGIKIGDSGYATEKKGNGDATPGPDASSSSALGDNKPAGDVGKLLSP